MKRSPMLGVVLSFVLSFVTIVALVAFPSPLMAKKGGGGGGGGKGGAPAPAPAPPPAPPPPPPPPSSSSDPNAGPVPMNTTPLDDAQRALTQAQDAYNAFVTAKKTEFEAGPDFQTAKKAVEEDSKTLDTAQAPLREQLKASNSRYAQALDDLPAAQEKLMAAVASKKADEITFRRADVQDLQKVIANAEKPVFSKDAAVVAAQTKLDADKKVLAEMQGKFSDFLNNNPDFGALSKALANAQARVTALKTPSAAP